MESQGEDLEAFMEQEIFTPPRINQILTKLVQKYIVLSQKELEQWDQDSMGFFLNKKEWGNDVKGNYLRERAENLVVSINLRYGEVFSAFCDEIAAELQKPEISAGSVEA